MLFNSQEFLFVFLPVTLLGFYLLGRVSRQCATLWLILASLVFYGWWRPLNILIIGPSIIINYLLASYLLQLSQRGDQPGLSRAVLLAGILFNVAFLGFFKYADFVYGAINDAFGANLILLHIILPLGISFITFQKIAFLIDVQAGRVKSFTFRGLLHLRSLLSPAHRRADRALPRDDAAVRHRDAGSTRRTSPSVLRCCSLACSRRWFLPTTSPPGDADLRAFRRRAGHTPFLLAWMAAIGFTLQVYFDFSGYTDMALGLGRFFGIKLPPNFNSPLKASSIIDFWLRWHMTLTRFLTAYIYNPMVLSLTRRRLAKGRSGFRRSQSYVGAFVSLWVPLISTMFISGLWHGAGYGFIILGLLHGVYLVINHGWRVYAAHRWRAHAAYARTMKPVGWVSDLYRGRRRHALLPRFDRAIGDRPGQRPVRTEWTLHAARRRGDRRDLWHGHREGGHVDRDPAVPRAHLSQHPANARSVRAGAGRQAGLDRADHRKASHAGVGAFAAVGGGDIGHRRGCDLFHRRPERVPLLAVLEQAGIWV